MKRLYLNLNLTGVIVTVAVGVLLPVMLSTAVGIVAIVMARDAVGIVTGVLIICFAITAIGSALIAVVLTGKKARLARRQADFVANVSHEFRSPLSAIRLYAQTLQSGKLAVDPERTAQCLATILRETESLELLVERVLTWRAASRNMMPLDMQTAPVTQTVNDAVERFQSMVVPDELSLSCVIESQLCVRHDPQALTTIVLNLLTNAYKYTGKQKEIRVKVHDEDDQVLIDVQDNGMGLSPAEARHIFQPFYRAEQHGGASGVGLGLTIAQHIIQRHQGTLTFTSEKGHGAIVTIRLPAAVEDA